jgi:hypothetical protein
MKRKHIIRLKKSQKIRPFQTNKTNLSQKQKIRLNLKINSKQLNKERMKRKHRIKHKVNKISITELKIKLKFKIRKNRNCKRVWIVWQLNLISFLIKQILN